VRTATGWKVEVISGWKKASNPLGRAVCRAHCQAARLLVDLGGGSCELTLSISGHIADMVSLP